MVLKTLRARSFAAPRVTALLRFSAASNSDFSPPNDTLGELGKGGALAPPKSRLPHAFCPEARAACGRKLRGPRDIGKIRSAP